MSQTSRRPRSFPVPTCWLHAGSDPSRSDHGHQCAGAPANALRPRVEMPLYAHDLACLHLRSSQPASVTSTIAVGAGVKSP
jgi:hypothetical protein